MVHLERSCREQCVLRPVRHHLKSTAVRQRQGPVLAVRSLDTLEERLVSFRRRCYIIAHEHGARLKVLLDDIKRGDNHWSPDCKYISQKGNSDGVDKSTYCRTIQNQALAHLSLTFPVNHLLSTGSKAQRSHQPLSNTLGPPPPSKPQTR